MPFISKQAVWLNADRSKAVEAGSPDAAFQLVGAGGTVSDEDAKRYKLSLDAAPPAYDAKADHEAKHGGETEQEAAAKHQAMLDGQPDPDGPPAENERGQKAKAPAANKAKAGAENK